MVLPLLTQTHLVGYLKASYGFVPCEREQVVLRDWSRTKQLTAQLLKSSHKCGGLTAEIGGSGSCTTHTKSELALPIAALLMAALLTEAPLRGFSSGAFPAQPRAPPLPAPGRR